MMNKPKKWTLVALSLIFGFMTWMGCQNTHSPAENSSAKGQPKDAGLLGRITESFHPETETLPAGTKIRIRLNQAVSTATARSGDEFLATLDSALIADNKTLAPAGSKVIGTLPYVKESGRVEGRAELQLTLSKMIVDGSEYDLKTHSLTVRAQGSEKKDAAVIAGSAAVGAIIGAISGGGKGAAIGAGVGGGGGTAYVLTTKGKQVEFRPETPMEFTLSEAINLPVQ